MRSARLLNRETGPRDVVISSSYQEYKRLTAAERADINTIRKCVEAGLDIPSRFYRPQSGSYDQVLNDYGVLHLHLGSDTSDTILFLKQYATKVLILETNSHQRFRNECRQLISSHKLAPVSAPTVVVKKKRRGSPPTKE